MNLSRRQLLSGMAGICTYACAHQHGFAAAANPFGTITSGSPSGPDTDPGPPSAPRRPTPGSASRPLFQGCSLTTAGRAALSDGGTQLLQSSGVPGIDAAFAREVNAFMIPMYGLSPYCCFFNDGDSPNAFATPQQLAGRGQGTVAFGVGLMNVLFTKFRGTSWASMGDHAAVAVFAHEFGHIAQFAFNFPRVAGKAPELHADFMAGWYTGTRAVQLYGRQVVNFGEITREMFDIGDNDFTSPSHHGTPQERVTAYSAGARFAVQNGGRADVRMAFVTGRQFIGI